MSVAIDALPPPFLSLSLSVASMPTLAALSPLAFLDGIFKPPPKWEFPKMGDPDVVITRNSRILITRTPK